MALADTARRSPIARPYTHPDVQLHVRRLHEEQLSAYGSADDPTDTSPGDYLPPHGLFIVVTIGGAPVACGSCAATVLARCRDGGVAASGAEPKVVAGTASAQVAMCALEPCLSLVADITYLAAYRSCDHGLLRYGAVRPWRRAR